MPGPWTTSGEETVLGRKSELWIGVLMLALSLAAYLFWIPYDSETPSIYEFRRQVYIGDAMLPLIAAAGIAICSLVHVILSFRRMEDNGGDGPFDSLTAVFFAVFGAICVVSLLLMFWAGPIAVSLFAQTGDEPVTYRQLRGAAPWKYIGYVFGGFTLVFGTTSLIEGHLSAKRAVSSILAVILLILIFDFPFDTILLPPNGDF